MIALMLAGFAQAQDDARIGACNVTFEVICMDCPADDEFQAEIYQFAADGTRMQVKYLPHMKSGESISSGNMTPGRRTLVIEEAEFVTVGCQNDENVHEKISVKLHSDTEPGEDEFEFQATPPPVFTATTTPSSPPPSTRVELEEVEEPEAEPAQPVRIGTPETPVVAEPPPATVPEPSPPVVTTTTAPPPPLAVSEPSTPSEPPPAREEEEDEAVVPYNVGWGAPGGPPIWVGNPGDYPGRGPGRNGTFLNREATQCEEGKLPLVVGTADHIVGGHVNQVALDDARATAVAPPNWDGEYVGYTGTTVVGDGAAAIYCVEPGTITRREPVAAVAAELPPPAPAGVTPQDLEALKDQLREELKPQAPPEVEPQPATAEAPLPFVLRKGAFMAFQYSTTFSEGVAYPHALAGGFVTFNLTPKTGRLGLEPYIGAGTDMESSHPCGVNDDGSLSMCSGWYLSTTAGVRLPWAVVQKDTFQLLVFPDLGLVSDDITVGMTSWGDLVSFQAGVEVWFTGKVPVALSLETGGTRLSLMNDDQQHTNGWAWPIRLDAKVAFK